jgi:tRNA-(ms[2]io[6]A)-hydroxylase
MLGLKTRTDPRWAAAALADEAALLQDHAHLERKAAGHVISLLGQVAGAEDQLLAVAREELQHFERVCGLLRTRGVALGPDPGNPYVQALARGPSTLLDRVLRMGVIEARSYEHFCLLAEAAPPGDVRDLFAGLKDSEAGHHAFFVKLAHERWPRDEVRARWDALAEREAQVVASLEWGPRVH